MKPVAMFAGLTLVVIALTGFVITMAYGSAPDAARAVWTSAVVAFAVQVMAFAIVKLSAKTNVMAGWGVGAILRFVVLGVYALVVVKALGLPSGAALLSLIAFFFLSTLLEPLLLNS
jgi:hypothetical protein